MGVTSSPMPPVPPVPPARIPGLRLPRRSRRLWPSAVASLVCHGALVALLLLEGRAALARRSRAAGLAGGGGGAGGVRPTINFFPLPPAAGPAAVDIPTLPRLSPTDLPALQQIQLELPRLSLPEERFTPVVAGAAGRSDGGAGQGPGAGGGQGAGVGPGVGPGQGPGTLGAGGYILLANPRGIIVPPDCARGRYEVAFWISADGRVTNVEANPVPTDLSCRRDFMERMRGYRFTPAMTRDGQPVASVFHITIIGRGN